MKLLTVLLMLSVPVQAQTLADAARKERARQAGIRSSHLYSGKGTRTEKTTPSNLPAAPAQAAPSPDSARPQTPKAAAVPAPEPVAVRNAEIARLQSKIAELEDQERALQLQVNQLTNQMLAPVSDQNANNEAQAQIGVAQSKLTAVRAELDEAKKTLDKMQPQGAPKQ